MLFRSYRCKNGAKINLPIYYRNKIYTEEERELLWIQKLNKGEVYVMDQVNKNWETKNMEKPGTFAEDVPEKISGGTPSEN